MGGTADWLRTRGRRDYDPKVAEDSAPDVEPASSNAQQNSSSGGSTDASGQRFDRRATDRTLPRWVIPAVAVFWLGFVLTFVLRHVFARLSGLLVLLLVSGFLALAIEPGVNRLALRGWRRGRSTLMILFGVFFAFLIFAGAVGTLVITEGAG